MTFITKNFTTIIIALLVLGGLYWYFFTGSSPAPVLSATASTTSASEEQFLTLVGELSPISFDTSIFSDPRFTSLQDISTPINPEPIGRSDPFQAPGQD